MGMIENYMEQVKFSADVITVGGVAIPGCVAADDIELLEDVEIGSHYTIRLTLMTGVKPIFAEGVTIDAEGNVRVDFEAQS